MLKKNKTQDETVETTDKDLAVWDWLPFIFQCNDFDFRHLIYQVTHLIHLHAIRRISSQTNIISGTVRDSQRYSAKIPQRRKVLCSRFIGLVRFKGFSYGFFLTFKCVLFLSCVCSRIRRKERRTKFKAHCSLVIRLVLTGYVALCECANKNCDSQNDADGGGGGGGADERWLLLRIPWNFKMFSSVMASCSCAQL